MIKQLHRVSVLWLVLATACGSSSGDQNTTAAMPQSSAGSASPAANGGSGAATAKAGTGGASSGTSKPQAGSGAAAVGGSGAKPAAGGTGAAGMSAAMAGAGGTANAAGAMATAGTSGAAGSAGAAGGGAASGDCDRACLLMVMQNYLQAMVAHDPSKVPLSPSLKMTDNGMTAKPGDGLWKTGTEIVKDKELDYADPTTKNVGSQVLINEGTSPAMYEVRLKVEGGMITEIESMTVRQAGAANNFFSPDNLKPEPVFLQMPDASQKMTRDQLMATMELYLDYLEGKKNGSQVPFDMNCKRYENGVATASGLASFQAQSWSFMTTRRILIIDEESQIVWGMFPFMQSDTALVVGEAFKMLGGKIMMIQAIMAYMPSKAWN
jgi:hypothetical protein